MKYKIILLLLLIATSQFVNTKKVEADLVVTRTIVGKIAPHFIKEPQESVSSTASSPTNTGSKITFKATALDENKDDYYLAICKTGNISPTTDGMPVCVDGEWCISEAVISGEEASCEYTIPEDETEEFSVWFGFVCDGAQSASCSSPSQGSGDNGSPYYVNHRPQFTKISNNSPQDPGGKIIWEAAAFDPDMSFSQDQVKMIVCKTKGIIGTECDGGDEDMWCSTDYTLENPVCIYEISLPSIDGKFDAFAYVFDSHGHASGSELQATNSHFEINNTIPEISNISLNNGENIELIEGSTKEVSITATITDTNSCINTDDLIVEASLYRSGIGYDSCNEKHHANNNNCYPTNTCIRVESGNTCTGEEDSSIDYICKTSVQYHADATDFGSKYEDQNWQTSVKIINSSGEQKVSEINEGVEVISLVGFDFSPSFLNYGTLIQGKRTQFTDNEVIIRATGNTGLDAAVYGSNLTSNEGDVIPVSSQRYTMSSSTPFALATPLTTNSTEIELNCPKTLSDLSPSASSTYWAIEVPQNTIPGSYSATIILAASKAELEDW